MYLRIRVVWIMTLCRWCPRRESLSVEEDVTFLWEVGNSQPSDKISPLRRPKFCDLQSLPVAFCWKVYVQQLWTFQMISKTKSYCLLLQDKRMSHIEESTSQELCRQNTITYRSTKTLFKSFVASCLRTSTTVASIIKHVYERKNSSANVEISGRPDLPLDTTGTWHLPTFQRNLLLPSSWRC